MTTCAVRGCDAHAEAKFRWPTTVGYVLFDVCGPHKAWLDEHPDEVTSAWTLDRTGRELVLTEAA